MNKAKSSPEPNATSVIIPTTFSHRAYTLIGLTFILFEVIFITLYANKFWFDVDVLNLGVIAIVIAAVINHYLLTWTESAKGCEFFFPIWKGKPAVIYRKLVETDTTLGITYGLRHIKWEAIDELELTIFGNLVIKSRSICGTAAFTPDIVVKLPFGSINQEQQTQLINTALSKKAEIVTNDRLKKRIAAKEIKGTPLVQWVTIIVMLLLLCDLGQSTFSFLEMSKEYYLCKADALAGKAPEAERHLKTGDYICNHPIPISWVNMRLFGQGAAAASVHKLKAEALWLLGHQKEAIEQAQESVKLSPKNFRLNLFLARLYVKASQPALASGQISKAIDNHHDSLLPRLYMLAELKAEDKQNMVTKFYQLYMDELQEAVFDDEPAWPPGGDRFLHEIMYEDDVKFIFNKLLKQQVLPHKN